MATHRWGPCELDEARRSLSAHGREIRLQPRVFDLTCYLVRHRDRVVSKDELLESLWPGTVVVDNALQRAVSLARVGLAEAGLVDAIRTHARHGYRFCVPEPLAARDVSGPDPGAPLERARQACSDFDWTAACDAFAEADAASRLAPAEVEEWGRAAICAGRGATVLTALERACTEAAASGDDRSAARATLLLVQIRTDQNQGVLARGLLQRAARHLGGGQVTPERGHFAWMSSRLALGAGEADTALALANEACTIGRALRDPDVESLGLAYGGHALLARGDVVRAVEQHEEAAAVVRLGGVQPWVAGWVLCSILFAARHRCDWVRATQFAQTYVEWSRSARMPAFPGTCQLHRAAVLVVQGEFELAEREARAAAASLPTLAPYAEGDAYCVLGEIQLGIGDFAAAEASFRKANALGWDPQPGLAKLHLLTGRPALAMRGLEHALTDDTKWTLLERRGQLLCLLVHAALTCGEMERAEAVLRSIDADDARLLATEALRAMHLVVSGEMDVARGRTDVAIGRFRRAIHHWRDVGAPLCEAEARLRLAECLLTSGDSGLAELQLEAIAAGCPTFKALHPERWRMLEGAVRAAG